MINVYICNYYSYKKLAIKDEISFYIISHSFGKPVLDRFPKNGNTYAQTRTHTFTNTKALTQTYSRNGKHIRLTYIKLSNKLLKGS